LEYPGRGLQQPLRRRANFDGEMRRILVQKLGDRSEKRHYISSSRGSLDFFMTGLNDFYDGFNDLIDNTLVEAMP
jgi:hypothetical protein